MEDKIVLTKEDLKHYAKDCILGEMVGLDIINALIERAKRKEQEATKKTATEILTHLKNRQLIGEYELNKLAEKYGVEIKE